MKLRTWIIIIGAGILILGIIAAIGASHHLVSDNNTTTTPGIVIGTYENYIHTAKDHTPFPRIT